MYFHSRHQAGRMLASRLITKYRYENCVIMSIDEGGVAVGSEIARQLHCTLNVTVAAEVRLPREPWAVGGLSSDGQFVYNSQYSKGDIDEIAQENRGYIEQQKIEKFHLLNRLVSSTTSVDKRSLKGHNIILTSDGLQNTFKLDVVKAYLKTVNYHKLIIACPIASVKVVDWMHVFADEIYCLSVIEEVVEVNHYYDVFDVPSDEEIHDMVKSNILNWI